MLPHLKQIKLSRRASLVLPPWAKAAGNGDARMALRAAELLPAEMGRNDYVQFHDPFR